MSTIIRRLHLNGTEFIPVTAAEAVVVNTDNLPGFDKVGITTLEKVLLSVLSAIGATSGDLTELILVINNKQDKLIPGTGIVIESDGTIRLSETYTLYEVVPSLPTPSANTMNKIYVVPKLSDTSKSNIHEEHITLKISETTYRWELIGQIISEVDLSGYVSLTNGVTVLHTGINKEYNLSKYGIGSSKEQ